MPDYGAIGKVSKITFSSPIITVASYATAKSTGKQSYCATVVRPVPLTPMFRGLALISQRRLPMWAYGPNTAEAFQSATNGTITGTVAVGAIKSPYSTVCLYYRTSGILIYKMRTDVNGAFTFPGLDPTSNEYFAVAYDPSATITFDALLFDRITPKAS